MRTAAEEHLRAMSECDRVALVDTIRRIVARRGRHNLKGRAYDAVQDVLGHNRAGADAERARRLRSLVANLRDEDLLALAETAPYTTHEEVAG